ncbi:MAG: hypothetical protein M1834_002311 [Cirrosporium novae-zelandiae]|nr:MAG: hypothetical protein M1834_002311 [Cirrosporium novae-zelandiae]
MARYGYGILVIGFPAAKEDGDNSTPVGAVVGVFKNGNSLKLESPGDEGSISILKECSLKAFESLELTVAYKLQHIPPISLPWRDSVLQSRDVDVDKIIKDSQTGLPNWAPRNDEKLGWYLRRNLEHILSVCSIPLKEDNDSFVKNTNSPVAPVALTCGDFGDHRICMSGSFFAFKFLLSMFKHLDKSQGKYPISESLLIRIHKTCKGHLQWISQASIEDNGFGSNYWVNGKVIVQDESQTTLPANTPVSTPVQILKAFEYLEVFKTKNDFIYVTRWLGSLVKAWFKQLNKTKNRLALTWPRNTNPVIATYRLDDHVWIWMALDSIEKLILRAEKLSISSPNPVLEEFVKLRSHLGGTRKRNRQVDISNNEQWAYTPAETKKQILRRFTTENDVSRKRMLSVTRSAQETRFLFHSRDTVLYYGMDQGFFSDEPHSNLWHNLIDYQQLYEYENDESLWNNPLRYALAILMGIKGHRLDRQYTPSKIIGHARQILFDSAAANGCFPGQIDEETKEPRVFDHEIYRDFYFHAGFEIPYILLLVSKQEVNKKPSLNFEITIDRPMPHLTPDRQSKRQLVITNPLMHSSPNPNDIEYNPLLSDKEESSGLGKKNVDSYRQESRHSERWQCYSSNIVEISEEWLYNYPRFLDFKPPQTLKDVGKALEELKDRCGGIITNICSDKNCTANSIVTGNYFNNETFQSGRVAICDIPKHQHKGKREGSSMPFSAKSYFSHREIWEKLNEKRTADTIKKRVIYLDGADRKTALICYLTSPEVEREHLSQFFDRHMSLRGFFIDNATAALNTWETELHLNYYLFVKSELVQSDQDTLSTKRTIFSFPNGISFHISEATMGFRIVGDFFDRYWTSYIIENTNRNIAKSEPLKAEDREIEDGELSELNPPPSENERFWEKGLNHDHWQQRKISELILFDRILVVISENAKKFINETEETCGVGKKNPSRKLSLNAYKIEDLQELLRVLITLKSNFASILEYIDSWENREKVRGYEQPRWTRSDETKYRRTINRQLAFNGRSISKLKTQKSRIEFLITLVQSIQDGLRADTSLREAENIQLFTYTTVFFLPVGLATSIFSMGSVPDHKLVISMVITAAVALSITAIILYAVLHIRVHDTGRSFGSKNIWLWVKDFKAISFCMRSIRIPNTKRLSRFGNIPRRMKESMQPMLSLRRKPENNSRGNDVESGDREDLTSDTF